MNSMDHNKQSEMSSHVEQVAEKPGVLQNSNPPSEDDREERVTSKAWGSIFVCFV